MTNDLAIRILNGDILGTTEQTHEAVAMAVKALSALPSEQPDVPDTTFGNMISRQAAIDAVRSYYDECDEREESIEERIERLPSADIDLSGFSDKLWRAAYERGKAEAVRHDVTDTNVGDMISRQAAIQIVHGELDECLVWDESGEQTANEVENILYRVPSVDAVEVVRCKDCKYRDADDFCTGRGYPNALVSDDGFCDKGERRE